MRIKIPANWRIPAAAVFATVALALTVALLAVALASTALTEEVRGQQTNAGEASDFKLHLQDHDPPHQAQVKTLLEGAKAELLPASGGRILFTDAKLSNFNTNGALESLAETPQCVFDSAGKTISSARTLQMRTADQRFRLEGVGFFIQVTNSSLEISNHVDLTIRRMPGKRLRQ